MKNKIILTFILFLSLNSLFPQSKNEQILLLKNKIDSLNAVIEHEKSFSIEKNYENEKLRSQIDDLSSKLIFSQSTVSNADKEITSLKNEIIKLNSSINELEEKLEKKKASVINRRSNCLFIRGNKPIKGFEVEFYFYPKERMGCCTENYFTGYCVFIFWKDGKFFPFQFESISLPLFAAKDIEFSEDSSEILNCPFQEITIEIDSLPFSFKDINFDNVDELLITNKNGGQRFVDGYRPFQFSTNSIQDVSYWIKEELFDEMTEFDYIKKQILFKASNGADSSYSTLYQAIYENGSFMYFRFIKKIPN
jgi:hypothetical protein